MGNFKRQISSLIIVLVFSSFSLIIPASFGQNGTNESGIISSDTTWTTSGSPYSFIGNVLVNNGITLTIEAGVTVNLNSYYMVVNGTLQVKGTNTNPVRFNGGIKDYDVLRFNSLNTYDELTGTGNVLDHTYFSGGIGISNGSSPKIVNSVINAVSVWYGGSPIISNNQIDSGIYVFGTSGSSLITYNSIRGRGVAVENSGVQATISNNNIEAQDGGYGISTQGIVIITGNSVSHGISASGTFQISNNAISGGISISRASGTISNNSINAATSGINITPDYYGPTDVLIQDNVIRDCTAGINDVSASAITLRQTVSVHGNVNIQRNLISNNGNGIVCSSDDNLTIQYNTIVGSSVGISTPGTSTITAYNNIQDNTINMKAGTANADAKNNWWGTSDPQAIKQKIYDFNNDFNLGTISFTPFLSTPNIQAPSIDTSISTPTPASPTAQQSGSPNPTSTLMPTPSVPEFSTLAILYSIIIMSFMMFMLLRKKLHPKPSS